MNAKCILIIIYCRCIAVWMCIIPQWPLSLTMRVKTTPVDYVRVWVHVHRLARRCPLALLLLLLSPVAWIRVILLPVRRISTATLPLTMLVGTSPVTTLHTPTAGTTRLKGTIILPRHSTSAKKSMPVHPHMALDKGWIRVIIHSTRATTATATTTPRIHTGTLTHKFPLPLFRPLHMTTPGRKKSITNSADSCVLSEKRRKKSFFCRS